MPVQDADLPAPSGDPVFRIAWRKRLVDHDGEHGVVGGIEKWLRLVEATGLTRIRAIRGEGILPATRYAVDAYIKFIAQGTHLEAVASSLTALFSRKLIALRMDRLREFYPWMAEGLDFFTGRFPQGPEEAQFA